MTEDTRPQPEDSYGIAKYAVEQELHACHDMFGLRYVIFRPHNVFGPRQNIGDRYRNVVGIFMNQILQGKPMTIFGDGTQTRAFSYIDDVAPVIARAIDLPEAWDDVFNIGADRPYSLNEVAESVARAMGVSPEIVHLRSTRRGRPCTLVARQGSPRIWRSRPDRDWMTACARWRTGCESGARVPARRSTESRSRRISHGSGQTHDWPWAVATGERISRRSPDRGSRTRAGLASGRRSSRVLDRAGRARARNRRGILLLDQRRPSQEEGRGRHLARDAPVCGGRRRAADSRRLAAPCRRLAVRCSTWCSRRTSSSISTRRQRPPSWRT